MLWCQLYKTTENNPLKKDNSKPKVRAEKQVGVVRFWIHFKDRAKSFADGLDARSNKRKKKKIQDDSTVWLVSGTGKTELLFTKLEKRAGRTGLREDSLDMLNLRYY